MHYQFFPNNLRQNHHLHIFTLNNLVSFMQNYNLLACTKKLKRKPPGIDPVSYTLLYEQ